MNVIYKTTNLINNKIYIGKKIEDRKDYYGSGTAIKLAINKYGKENFKKEIIEKCNNKEELIEREKYWIEKLNSKYPNGYNITDGGKGTLGFRHTNEAKQKISKALKGKPHARQNWNYTEETKQKMSKSRKGKIPYWIAGKSPSKETREKMKLAWVKRKRELAKEGKTGIRSGSKISEKHKEIVRNYWKTAPMESRKKLSNAVKLSWPKRKIKYGPSGRNKK